MRDWRLPRTNHGLTTVVTWGSPLPLPMWYRPDQWLNKNDGLFMSAQAMSCAAVSRRAAACATLISRSRRRLEKRTIGLHRLLGKFKLGAQLLELLIDRKRCLAGIQSVILRPQLLIHGPEIRPQGLLLGIAAQLGRHGEDRGKSSGRVSPTGLPLRVAEMRNRPSVHTSW